jgi:ribosomal protein L37AE/L43A
LKIFENIEEQKAKKGRRAMARLDSGSLPHGNPCAQCGKPIAAPDWVEAGPRRTSYLWRCQACDYRFEAMAYFAESDQQAIAA